MTARWPSGDHAVERIGGLWVEDPYSTAVLCGINQTEDRNCAVVDRGRRGTRSRRRRGRRRQKRRRRRRERKEEEEEKEGEEEESVEERIKEKKRKKQKRRFVCWLVGCLTSQQHAGVCLGRICSDNLTCCHTEIEVADPTFYLTQSQYTDTGPTSPSVDRITPGAWQGSHWSANF